MKNGDDFRAILRVTRLGAIEDAGIEIRPLTLFFGPNGTNKTWTAYSLYGLLTKLLDPAFLIDHLEQCGFIERAAAALGAGATEPAYTDLGAAAVFACLPDALQAEMGPSAIADLLGHGRELDPQADVRLTLAPRQTLWSRWPLRMPFALMPPREADAKQYLSTLDDPGSHAEAFLRQVIRGLARDASAPIIALPAERKALTVLHEQLSALTMASLLDTVDRHSTTPPTRAHALSSAIASRRLQAAARLERTLPRPSIDFIAFLNSLATRTKRSHAHYQSLAEHLEDSLLGGAIDFATEPHDTLAFTHGGKSIDLHISSSLARAMAGLDLFLRYEARPGSFILIDEPEMNAHPRTQLAIAEFIALMVNRGLRVIATTHSPYIVDHLHNLMEAGRLSPERQAAVAPKFRLGTPDAFLDPEQVATWLFTERGTVENAFDRANRSIDWQTFSAATDDMANLYSELLIEAGDDEP